VYDLDDRTIPRDTWLLIIAFNIADCSLLKKQL
jgi:hypothetical protein